MKTVKMLVSSGCKDCEACKARLSRISSDVGVAISIKEMSFDSSEAIDLAIEYGLDQVPSFVVESRGFNGMAFDAQELVKTLRI